MTEQTFPQTRPHAYIHYITASGTPHAPSRDLLGNLRTTSLAHGETHSAAAQCTLPPCESRWVHTWPGIHRLLLVHMRQQNQSLPASPDLSRRAITALMRQAAQGVASPHQMHPVIQHANIMRTVQQSSLNPHGLHSLSAYGTSKSSLPASPDLSRRAITALMRSGRSVCGEPWPDASIWSSMRASCTQCSKAS